VAQQNPGRHPFSPPSLVDTAAQLVQASINPASQVSYHRALQDFHTFCMSTLHVSSGLPALSGAILSYIAHLYRSGYAASSIHRIISILAYYHKLYQFPDPTQSFLVKKALSGVSKSIPSVDLRSPITPALLQSLVSSCPHMSSSQYNSSLLSSMYLLAFHAFLRVGEMTVTNAKASNPNLLQRTHIAVLPDHAVVTFSSFKHHSGPPITLSIQANNTQFCPVAHMSRYLSIRGTSPGPLFQFTDGSPVTRTFFTRQLASSLIWSNHTSHHIRSHSFRIGAATTAAASGHSDEAIQRMGRWKSSSFRKYIRIPSLHL
jgi:hypothetical protein